MGSPVIVELIPYQWEKVLISIPLAVGSQDRQKPAAQNYKCCEAPEMITWLKDKGQALDQNKCIAHSVISFL